MIDVGSRLTLLCDIYDDGEDHHPPGYCARSGETVIVRKVMDHGRFAVSHEDVTDSAFIIYALEYEDVSDDCCVGQGTEKG